MPSTLTINIKDVNDQTVSGCTAVVSVWTGSGNVQNVVPQSLTGGTLVVSLADALIHVSVRLQHMNFADCTVVFNRTNKTTPWLWLGCVLQLSQSASDITCVAVMRRLRAAPQQRMSTGQINDLQSKAGPAKAAQLQQWQAAKQKGDPPFLTDLQSACGYLVRDATSDAISFPMPEPQKNLHMMKPDPLGDATKSGWDRFTSITANADPGKDGVFLLLEYGDVSPLVSQAPRFLVACWVPQGLLKAAAKAVDFLIWFTPTVTGEFYPPDAYPFRKAYPYEIWAGGTPTDAFFVQRYLLLPSLHMTRAKGEPTSHYLTYLTAAAGKSTVVVVPVCPAAPKAAYEAFESQAGLMRLLKELCLQISLLRQDQPAAYGPPPQVGQIVVAGLSAGVQRSMTVIGAASALSPYTDPRWQSSSTEFRQKWKDFWSFDAAFLDVKDAKSGKVVTGGDQFRSFLNAAASWVQQTDDRHLRIYKTDFTAGANVGKQWDPRLETAALFRRMLKASAPVSVQESKAPFAVSMNDARRRWQCISLSEEYMRDPTGSTGLPEIPIGRDEFMKQNPKAKIYKIYHDAVPRMFLGHALVTSNLT